jgi:hypothetical protein
VDVVMRIFTLGVASIGFLLVAWTIWRMRRPQRLRWLSPAIAIAGSLAALVVYLALIGISVKPLPLIALIAVGAGIGVLALRFVRIEARDGQRFVQRTQWFLGIWALALIGLQVVSAFDSPDTFAAGIAATALSVGMVTALNVGLLRLHLGGASSEVSG